MAHYWQSRVRARNINGLGCSIRKPAWLAALAILLSSPSGPVAAAEWDLSGFVGAELRAFPEEPAFADQKDATLSPSIVAEPRLTIYPDRWVDRITFVPFGRLDADDSRRTHADIREANLLFEGDTWDLVLGIDQRFWGVTESRHLINIVNQTDQVEGVRQEEFLGQPMVNFNVIQPFGTFGFFVLPGFRERTFPADDARLRGPFPIDVNDAEFEADAGKKHVDFAIRYSHVLGPLDIGLAYFRGTSREPRLVPRMDAGGEIELVPFYDLIDQASLDAQFTRGSWQLKLEAMTRGGQGDRFFAAVGGFEYTWFDAFGSGADIGFLGEYINDGRDQQAAPVPFEDAIFAGLRVSLNDPSSTTLLAGTTVDREDGSTVLRIEAQRRLGERWLLSLDGHLFANIDRDNLINGVRDDSYLQLRLSFFF